MKIPHLPTNQTNMLFGHESFCAILSFSRLKSWLARIPPPYGAVQGPCEILRHDDSGENLLLVRVELDDSGLGLKTHLSSPKRHGRRLHNVKTKPQSKYRFHHPKIDWCSGRLEFLGSWCD